MAQGWEFILAVSSTMETISKIANPHDRTLSLDLNKSGTSSLWIPTKERTAGYVSPWTTCLKVQYDNDVLWSGPITTRTTNAAAGRVSISAVGWFDRLMSINIQEENLSFVGKDAGFVAAALLQKARDQDPTMPITIGTVETTQLRTINYTQGQNIGQAIIDLGEVESGYDWYVDPVTRQLNILARRMNDRPDCKWIYVRDDDGLGSRNNLADVEELVDGTTLANDVTARGRFGSSRSIHVESKGAFGLFQKEVSLQDVIDVSILNAYVEGEIVYLAYPRVTYKMTPKAGTDPKVPRLFRDFDIGDKTYLTWRQDFIDIRSLPQRIFGASLNIQDNGVEVITNLQTTAS